MARLERSNSLSDMLEHFNIGATGPPVVVGIDFGTARTGFAFAFRTGGEAKIFQFDQWPEGPISGQAKTLTALLLDENGAFRAFGWDAQTQACNLSDEEAARMMYFAPFKMELYDQKMGKQTMAKATNGCQLSMIKVVEHVLRHVHEQAVKALGQQHAHQFKEEDICWVVTVPAIWSDGAKEIMREAATAAGLARSGSGRLLLALEPEAAAIDCLYEMKMHLSKGTRYLVVDCGGGTIDLTLYEVGSSSHGIKQVIPPSGGNWGSTVIDRAFWQLLVDIFGPLRTDVLRRSPDYVSLMAEFEKHKISNLYNAKNFLLPMSLLEDPGGSCGRRGEELVAEYNRAHDANLQLNRGNTLRILEPMWRRLFEPAIAETVQHVRETLRNTSSVSHVFLVGGFAACAMLQERLRAAIGSSPAIHIPTRPGQAVLMGAVRFGLNPTIVTHRRSRFTYGVGMAVNFDPAIHDPKHRFVADGVAMCGDIFKVFARLGDEIAVDQAVKHDFSPLYKSQTSVTFKICSVERTHVLYIDDLGVNCIGKLTIEVPSAVQSPTADRSATCEMKFGGTEIMVTAKNAAGASVKTTCSFQ